MLSSCKKHLLREAAPLSEKALPWADIHVLPHLPAKEYTTTRSLSCNLNLYESRSDMQSHRQS